MYLVLLGPPGTGKGTQAKRIAQQLGLVHISSGDMFRDAVGQGSAFGKRVKVYMDRGELVPDELTIAMLLERLRQPDASRGVVFDGFPRNVQQAQALDEAMAGQEKSIDAGLLIGASDDEIVRRLTGRWLCGACGEIYHEHSRPPKHAGVCDRCGGSIAQRDDDRPDVVRARLERQRPPADLLAHYRNQGKLREVNGEQDINAVTRDLLQAIEEVVPTAQ